LLALGGEDVDVPRDEGTRAVDPVGAPTQDDKMLLDYLKHVSQPKVYFLIESTICDTDFCFCTGTCLSRARIATKASKAAEQSRVAELEEANAWLRLRAELEEARAKKSEAEGRENVLKSNYSSLCNDYRNLETILVELQWEKTEAEKACDTIHDKFQKIHTHFHTRLHDVQQEREKFLSELGGRCLEYPETSGTIGCILNGFKEEIQALADIFAEANENITCFTMACILRMLEESGCGVVPELPGFTSSSDASVLRDIPEEIEKIVERLVRSWWTHHNLSYCMCRLKEDNQVSFVLMSSFRV
jgi:hypothetical protein